MVVGAGPNGLAAAVALARAGHSVQVLEGASTIGGGTRTEELTLPGLLHDVCSAAHPFAVASPFLQQLPLAEHGLRWCHPELPLVHPLDHGRSAVVHRTWAETVRGMGPDAAAWRRTFEWVTTAFDDLTDDLLRPVLHLPAHPLPLARFGLQALPSARWMTRRWRTPEARALFGGAAAHGFQPLHRPTTAALGMVLLAAAQRVGWPVARGGSRAITDALASLLRAEGGTIHTDKTVTSFADLPPHRVALFDVSPAAFARMAGAALPARVASAYRRYRYGPAAYKVDLAVEGGIPWAAEPARRAGTVHVGGTFEEVAYAEAEVHRGRMPERPFVLVGQQYLADPTRSKGNVHPIWAYAHVPHAWTGDVSGAVLAQLERFAPGTRDRVLATAVRGPAELAAHNPNYVGGDISTGANDPWQLLFRPRFAANPYATGIPGVYLCSAATPPGAGVHGMCGFHAAHHALRDLHRMR